VGARPKRLNQPPSAARAPASVSGAATGPQITFSSSGDGRTD